MMVIMVVVLAAIDKVLDFVPPKRRQRKGVEAICCDWHATSLARKGCGALVVSRGKIGQATSTKVRK